MKRFVALITLLLSCVSLFACQYPQDEYSNDERLTHDGTPGLDFYPVEFYCTDDDIYMHYGVMAGKAKYLMNIVIPSTYDSINVVEILDHGFEGATHLQSVQIPQTIGYICSYAFAGCHNLRNISFPSALCRIEDKAFSNCSTFTKVDLTDTKCDSIGNNAFENCDQLEAVFLPSSLYRLGEASFSRCSSLKNVIFSENCQLEHLEAQTFSECHSLISIQLPEGIASIGNNTFSKCSSLQTITIPDNVTSIEPATFYECSALENIKLPSHLEYIFSDAFSGCSSLKHIEFPSSLTYIDSGAFEGCLSLETIVFNGTTEQWSNVTVLGDGFTNTSASYVQCTNGTVPIILIN